MLPSDSRVLFSFFSNGELTSEKQTNQIPKVLRIPNVSKFLFDLIEKLFYVLNECIVFI